MKKFISMLAGVVMASSLFAVSAYAANVSATADKTEVEVGEKVVVTINSAAKNIATDSFNVGFDADMFTVDSIVNNKGVASFTVNYYDELEEATMSVKYSSVTVDEANTNGGFVSFWYVGTDPVSYNKKAPFAIITFTAKKAGTASFVLEEDSAGGDDWNKGVASTINVTVNAAVEEPTVTWNEADASWAAPEGKKAIWWPFDFEAGAFPGHVFVEITDGTRTEEIGIGANADYDVNGAVSFAVAVILGADVDATNFNCTIK